MTKQEAAIKYITENYLDHNRLRHDVVSDKLQIRDEHSLESFRMVQNGSAVVQNGSAMVQNSSELSSTSKQPLNHSTQFYTTAKQPLHHSTPYFWREMSKHDINSIVCHAAQEYDQNITSREVLTALQSDLIPDVHPLREYIQSLKPYTNDQPDWIDMVARQVHVKTNNNEVGSKNKDNLNNLCSAPQKSADFSGTPPRPTLALAKDDMFPLSQPLSNVGEAEELSMLSSDKNHPTPSADTLWRICFKKWFVAMVASWMYDEVVNHQVLVLIGRQGIYKTTWLEHLIPPHLREYCCKLANATQLNKDDRLRIAEFGLINLDELDAMTPRELNAMKSIITATDVNERVAYGYTKERRIRMASFCASSNRREFLTDITGNRRWLPFEIENIQNPFFTTLPYDLMYAEAWALAQDPSFSYWFDLDEIEVLEEHNETFRAQESEEQLLPVYFAVPAEDAANAKFLTTAEISEKLVSLGNIKRPMPLNRLGVLLGQLGFQNVNKGVPRRRGWIVYEKDSDTINNERKIFGKTERMNS